MDAERFKKLREIVEGALALDAGERAAFVERACAGDAALASEAERWLAQAGGDAEYMEPRGHGLVLGLLGETGPAAASTLIGRRVGAYRVERALGSGGMGAVFLAVREGDFSQRVALKLIRAGLGDDDLVRRFRAERRVLASLEHPGIARLIDGGETDDGTPYLVMEYVEGLPIDRYCAERALGIEARLALFLEVCAAVQYAHRCLVVHRDLKPSNLLVTPEGRPVLLDFGIAKVLAPPEGEPTLDATATAMRAFTPRYASPEQVRGGRVTTASDVYSLGVLLYELVSGRAPYDFATDDPTDAARVVCEVVPRAPSLAVSTRGASAAPAAPPHPDFEPARLRRALAGDLDNIVLMALRKEPERRYASVVELAADVQRHLGHEPVRARPDTFRYRTAKFARRNRGALAAAAIAFVSLAAALTVSLAQERRAERAAREEARLREVAEDKTAEAERERERAEWRAYVASIAAAEAAIRSNDVADARQRLAAAPERYRNWEWRHLERRLDRSAFVFNAHKIVRALAFSPDERTLASAGDDRSVCLWDLERRALSQVVAEEVGRPTAVAFSPDGGRLAWNVTHGPVRVRELEGGATRDLAIPRERSAIGLAFAPDSRRLLCGGRGGAVDLRDVGTGELLRTFADLERDVAAVAIDAAGRYAAASSGDGSVHVWRLDDGVEVATVRGEPEWARKIAFDRTGERIAGGSRDGRVRVWDVAHSREVAQLHGHTGIVEGVAFLPDGRVLSASWDRTVRLWELEGERELSILRGHGGNIACVAVSPSGARIASGENGGDIRVWQADANDVRTVPNAAWSARLSFALDGELVACPDVDTVAMVEARTGRRVTEFAGTLASPDSGVAAACGERLAVIAGAGRAIDVWRIAAEPEHEATLALGQTVIDVEIDSGGRWLVAGTGDTRVRVWSLPWLTLVADAPSPAGIPTRLARHPCAERVAVCSTSGEVAVLSLPDLECLAERSLGASFVWDVAFSLDGRWLAAACFDSTVRVLDAATLAEVAVLRGHSRAVECVAFSPDGTRIASGATDYAIKLWDTERFEEVATLHGHGFTVRSLEFSPDGAQLASKASDGTVRLWDAGD